MSDPCDAARYCISVLLTEAWLLPGATSIRTRTSLNVSGSVSEHVSLSHEYPSNVRSRLLSYMSGITDGLVGVAGPRNLCVI